MFIFSILILNINKTLLFLQRHNGRRLFPQQTLQTIHIGIDVTIDFIDFGEELAFGLDNLHGLADVGLVLLQELFLRVYYLSDELLVALRELPDLLLREV
jgi:hypothetical protein